MGSHPLVKLRAVTVTPGSTHQVSLVRWLLQEMHLPGVRIGAQDWPNNANKGRMQGGFYKSFGSLETHEEDCEPADRVLRDCCDETTTLLTGAPLHNLKAALQLDGFHVGRWVAQGGFAGEGVVPQHLQMPKFQGKVSCATWNFGGNCKAAQEALSSFAIGRRVLVSKNVCHRTQYDEAFHKAVGDAVTRAEIESPASSRCRALRLLRQSMDKYRRNQKKAKKLHDPLALATALDESVCELAEVSLFRDRVGWGSVLADGSGTWISVDYDDDKFRAVLLDQR